MYSLFTLNLHRIMQSRESCGIEEPAVLLLDWLEQQSRNLPSTQGAMTLVTGQKEL